MHGLLRHQIKKWLLLTTEDATSRRFSAQTETTILGKIRNHVLHMLIGFLHMPSTFSLKVLRDRESAGQLGVQIVLLLMLPILGGQD